MKDLVFGMLATTTGRSTLMRSTRVSLVAMTLALLPTHVLRALHTARMAATAAVMIGALVIMLRIASCHSERCKRNDERSHPD